MTRDDILRMAREAGFVLASNATGEAMGRFSRFAALIAAEEREACAKVCDGRYNFEASRIAHIIRARGAHAQNPL